MSTVESPCVSVCELASDGVCVGCGRHVDEIMAWPRATDEERRAIRDLACVRMSIMAAESSHPTPKRR